MGVWYRFGLTQHRALSDSWVVSLTHGLEDGNSASLFRLKERGRPFAIFEATRRLREVRARDDPRHGRKLTTQDLVELPRMEMAALLVEQRRIGDEFRGVEKNVLGIRNLLSGLGLTAPTRARAEAMLYSNCAELIRLGRTQLELDASVSLAAAMRR